MQLLRANGDTAVVVDIANTHRTALTYNIEVADFHTYFVGEEHVWVHNSCISAARAALRAMGLSGINLRGMTLSAGRRALSNAGFVESSTARGRLVFTHPETGARVTYDGLGGSLGRGQSPHWTIQDASGQFYGSSGRPVSGPSSPMGGRHIRAG